MKRNFYWVIILIVIVLFGLFALGSSSDQPTSNTGITELKFLWTDTVDLDVGESKSSSYFTVSGNDKFSINDIEFISTSPEVATFEYDETALTTFVYYKITALSPGETKIYVQTKDGVIKSDEIIVRVSGSTTTELSTSPETEQTQSTTEEPKKIISTNFINFDIAWDNMTDLQQDTFWKQNKYNYVQWSGKIVEVTKDTISVVVRNDTLRSDFTAVIVKEQRTELINLNIGDTITIKGQLIMKKGVILPWAIGDAEIV